MFSRSLRFLKPNYRYVVQGIPSGASSAPQQAASLPVVLADFKTLEGAKKFVTKRSRAAASSGAAAAPPPPTILRMRVMYTVSMLYPTRAAMGSESVRVQLGEFDTIDAAETWQATGECKAIAALRRSKDKWALKGEGLENITFSIDTVFLPS